MLFDFCIHRQFRSILSHDHSGSKATEADRHLADQIDKISELLAFIVVYDPETMIELNTWFEEISHMASNDSQTYVSTMAVAAAQLSEELILHPPLTSEFDEMPQADRVDVMQDQIEQRLVEILDSMGLNVSSVRSSNADVETRQAVSS